MDNKDNQKKSFQDLMGGKKKKIVIKKGASGNKNLADNIKKAKDESAKKGTASKTQAKPAKGGAKSGGGTRPAPQQTGPREFSEAPKPVEQVTRQEEPAQSQPQGGGQSKQPAARQNKPQGGGGQAPAKKPAERTPRISFELPGKKPKPKTGGGRGPGGRDNRSGGPGRKPQTAGDVPQRGGGPGGGPPPAQFQYAQSGFRAPAKRGGNAYAKKRTGGAGGRKKEQTPKGGAPHHQRKREAEKPVVPAEIDILENVTVGELARKLNVKVSYLIGNMMKMGMMGTINDVLDSETATLIAEELGAKVKIISLYEETVIQEEEGEADDVVGRAPIITVMGHVDHGKTKLLDTIRSQDVVATEAGGITQHIGAYKVHTKFGDIVFLDTPGHEAFTTMRARGSSITDIVILVVAADDGVKPQTVEAISHAKAAEVPIIVALNKIDKPDANPKKVIEELSSHDLVPEDWGGTTQYIEISALQGTGIDKLLEAISLQAEMLELKANPVVKATGTVVEARLDPGRGPVSTILVQKGQLKQGDPVVVGRFSGKVRALFDDKENRLKEVGPSTPVEILGIEGVPEAGDPFQVVTSDKEAKNISDKRHELDRFNQAKKLKPVSLDDLNEMVAEGDVKELNVIVKADVRGSIEAIQESLIKLSEKSESVKVKIVHAQTGGIIESDVMLASASNAIILGFHVRPNAKTTQLAEKEQIQIKYYSVIYDLLEDVERALTGMLEPKFEEQALGSAEIRELFKISKIGTIGGSMVLNGKMKKNAQARVVREGIVIYEGIIKGLRRVKDDVNEVNEGFECGIFMDNFNDIKEGDVVEAFEMAEVKTKL